MEEPKQKPDRADEIDLADFFRWVGRGFSNLGTSIIGGIASLRNQFFQNRVFFGSIILLGLVLGALYSELLKRDHYRSSMVLSCDYLNEEALKNQIQKFNLLALETDRDGLQEAFVIDAATAKNVLKFDFRPLVSEDDVVKIEILRQQLNSIVGERRELVNEVINQLEIERKSTYEISVYVYDPDIVKPLEKALVDYFRSNPYIKSRIEANRERLTRRQAKLEGELRKLDSLKAVMVQNYRSLAEKGRGTNNVVVGAEEGIADPLKVVSADLKIYNELEEVRRKLALSSDFEVVEGFTSFKQPDTAGLADVLAASLLISIIVGYLILGARRFDRVLAEYPKKTQRASQA